MPGGVLWWDHQPSIALSKKIERLFYIFWPITKVVAGEYYRAVVFFVVSCSGRPQEGKPPPSDRGVIFSTQEGKNNVRKSEVSHLCAY